MTPNDRVVLLLFQFFRLGTWILLRYVEKACFRTGNHFYFDRCTSRHDLFLSANAVKIGFIDNRSRGNRLIFAKSGGLTHIKNQGAKLRGQSSRGKLGSGRTARGFTPRCRRFTSGCPCCWFRTFSTFSTFRAFGAFRAFRAFALKFFLPRLLD